MGHTAGLVIDRIGRPTRPLTMVRDPVDRVLSRVYFASNLGPGDLWHYYGDPNAHKGTSRPGFYNGQAHALLTPHYDTGLLVPSSEPPPDADRWRERLFGVLDRYDVGLQEAFEESSSASAPPLDGPRSSSRAPR